MEGGELRRRVVKALKRVRQVVGVGEVVLRRIEGVGDHGQVLFVMRFLRFRQMENGFGEGQDLRFLHSPYRFAVDGTRLRPLRNDDEIRARDEVDDPEYTVYDGGRSVEGQLGRSARERHFSRQPIDQQNLLDGTRRRRRRDEKLFRRRIETQRLMDRHLSTLTHQS